MVEIRELVIQARLREDVAGEPAVISLQKDLDEADEAEEMTAPPPDPEWVQKIVERCLYEVQAWWREKNLR